MSVSADDLRRVATLARVGVSESLIPEMLHDLNRILAHMDVLQQVDVNRGAGPSAAPPMRLRDDVNTPVALATERRAFAPAYRDGFFLVPRLESHGDVGASVASDDARLRHSLADSSRYRHRQPRSRCVPARSTRSRWSTRHLNAWTLWWRERLVSMPCSTPTP